MHYRVSRHVIPLPVFFGLRLDGRNSGGEVAESLADLHFLAVVDHKLEVLGCLEDEDDRAPETETSHLLCFQQRLAVQDG